MSNFIEEFDKNFNGDESLKHSIIDIIESANVDAPKNRKVSDTAVFQVAERALIASAHLEDNDVKFFNTLREVNNFISLVTDGPSANGEIKHTDLLPIGHPESTFQHNLPADTVRMLNAAWVSDDPRIVSDEARAIVAAVYASNPYSIDYAFNLVRLQSLPAGSVPAELSLQPIIAFGDPYAGKNSFWHRKMRAERQRRDDEGQFAEMGGGARFYTRLRNGSLLSVIGKIAGIPEDDPNGIDIEVTGVKGLKDGIYTVPSNLAHFFIAVLPEGHGGAKGAVVNPNLNVNAIDVKDLKRKDLPTSWFSTKVGAKVAALTNKATADRNFITGDGYQASMYSKMDDALQARIAEAQDKFKAQIIGAFGTTELDPNKPIYELVSSKRGQEEVVGYGQDWASVQKLATLEDKNYPDTENQAPIAQKEQPAPVAKPAAEPVAEVPTTEPVAEAPEAPFNPDANIPEGWSKISDGFYQSKDGKAFASYGEIALGALPTTNYDAENDEYSLDLNRSVIDGAFNVFDLTNSPITGTPLGIGFDWQDVQDIITSAAANPMEMWNPEEVEDITPPFMLFPDEDGYDALLAKVNDSAQYLREKLEKQGDDPDDSPLFYVSPYKNIFVDGQKVERAKTGPTHQAFDTHIITDPNIGRLYDEMNLNPEQFTQAQAAALAEVIRSTQEPNPKKTAKGYPAFIGKAAPKQRQVLLTALSRRTPPVGQESRTKEIYDNLYNLANDYQYDNKIQPVIDEINSSWGWGKGSEPRKIKDSAYDVAEQQGLPEPTPKYLYTDKERFAPTPAVMVAVESLLDNRVLQDLLDRGDDQNYTNFKENVFPNMTQELAKMWLEEHKDAPFKAEYTPEELGTNLEPESGATPRQLASLERMMNRRPGLLTEQEIADINEQVPNLTRHEVGQRFITPFRAREVDYVQSEINDRIAKGLPLDDIELMDGVIVPSDYVPGAVAPAAEIPSVDVYPEDLKFGDENGDKIIVDGVAHEITDIINQDGLYRIMYGDGKEVYVDQFEQVKVAAPVVDTTVEETAPDTRERFKFDNTGNAHQGTRYDLGTDLEIPVDDAVFRLPDNLSGFILQAVERRLPIDGFVLPDWYSNKETLQMKMRDMLNLKNQGVIKDGDTSILDNYKPSQTLSKDDQKYLAELQDFYNTYLGFAQDDIKNAEERIPVQREMAKIAEMLSNPDTYWSMYRDGMLNVGNIQSPKAVQVEEGDDSRREFEDYRVERIKAAALKADVALAREMITALQTEIAERLGDKEVTAQGKRIMQAAIKDLSELLPKMNLRNKNLPEPEQFDEVFARVRDGLLGTGNAETYGTLNRPSKALVDTLTEIASYANEVIGMYRAGSMSDKPNLMQFSDEPEVPRMKRFDPPAFEGPALEGIKDLKTFEELADFLYSKDIYIFDFETTGLVDPVDPEIKNDPIQLAVVRMSKGEIAGQVSTYINPESKLSSWTLRGVGDGQGGLVSREFLETQPTKREAMQMFLDNIPAGSIIAGHNGLLFDVEVLQRTLRESGLPEFEIGGFVDTLGMARYIMPQWSHETPDAPYVVNDYGKQRPSHTLEALVNYFSLSNNGRHEADADVISTYEILKKMLEFGKAGRAAKGKNFDAAASNNGFNRDDYTIAEIEYKAKMAQYMAETTVQMFSEGEINPDLAESILADNLNVIENSASSQQEDYRGPATLMAFKEPKNDKDLNPKQRKAKLAKQLKELEAVEVDTSIFANEPTEEGLNIVKAAKKRMNIVIQAYAGSGKTTVLENIAKMMKKDFPKLHGLYAVYNRHNRLEAEVRMPGNIEPRTFDSIAFSAVVNRDMVSKFWQLPKQQGANEPLTWTDTADIAEMFGMGEITLSNGIKMPSLVAAGLSIAAVNAWTLTADAEIGKEHFMTDQNKAPFIYEEWQSKDSSEIDESIFPEELVNKARHIWKHLQSPHDPDSVQMVPDFNHIFKNWQLSNPNLAEYDPVSKKSLHGLKNVPKFIMVDEAQDMNPVAFDIFKKQAEVHNNGIQMIVVGDTYQQINEFRGSIDAIDLIDRDITLPLSMSFRFGKQVADFANKILQFLGETDIKGNDEISTEIVSKDIYDINYIDDKVDAVITRTNYGVLRYAAFMKTNQPWAKIAVSKDFRDRYASIGSSLKWLMAGSNPDPKYPRGARPKNFYKPFGRVKTWDELVELNQRIEDKEIKAVFNILNQITKEYRLPGPWGAVNMLEEMVGNLRVKTDGFEVPVDAKGVIPKEGEIGNGLKYAFVGNRLEISDTGKYIYGSAREISGTANNKLTLRNMGFELKVENIPNSDKKRFIYVTENEKPYTKQEAESLIKEVVATLSGSDANLEALNTHASKGRQWDTVVLWDDFFTPDSEKEPEDGEEPQGEPKWKNPEELRIDYVAATRPIKTMYVGGLQFLYDGNYDRTKVSEEAANKRKSSPVVTTVDESKIRVNPALLNERTDVLKEIKALEDDIFLTDAEEQKLAGLKARLVELNQAIAAQEKELAGKKATKDEKPTLMEFPGGGYEQYTQDMIKRMEDDILLLERDLKKSPADRSTPYITSENLQMEIDGIKKNIEEIKSTPDFYKKRDISDLQIAQRVLEGLIANALPATLEVYADRWALRSDVAAGPSAAATKNRNRILGVKEKIRKLELFLGQAGDTEDYNPTLMAFDAADNIDDNESVVPALGMPGSDENPDTADLTEEIKSVNKSNQEVVSTVVASILEAMDKGIVPWKKPWSDEGGFLPTSGATGRVYRGVNLLALMAVSMNRDYTGTRWFTKNAISKLGGYVNKREDGKDPGVVISFVQMKKYDKEEKVQVPDPDNPGKTKTETQVVTKKFAKMGLDIVYNEDEIKGVQLPKLVRKDPPAISEVEGIVLDSYTDKPEIEYVPQDKAYWSPSEDIIRLPLREQFHSTEEHLDTLFHELTHSTGHQNRLDRKDLLENYGVHKDVRAREELIAEIGSAILAQMMNVNTSIDNVAAYVQSWSTYLKEDPNALHEAASLASKAVEHILGGYWDSVEGMVDLNEETEAKPIEAIDMPVGEITGVDGTSGGLGHGVNYRIEGESVILMGNTAAKKDIIKSTSITPEGKKRPFSFIFHGRNKYWFVTLGGDTGLGDRMRILAELKKKLDDENVTPA